MRSRSVLRGIAVATLMSACSSDEPSAPLFSGTTVEIVGAPSDSVLLTEGELQLSAIVRKADGTEVAGIVPKWSSTNADRASVSADGRVLGLRPGELSVRVNAGGATDERGISVRTRIPLPASSGAPLASTLLDGAMQITLNAAAVSGGAALHVRAVRDPTPADRLVSGTAIELGPSGIAFSAPVTLELRYPSSVPAAEQGLLRIHRLTDGEWRIVSGGSVDISAGRVRAPITRTGTYAVVRSVAETVSLVITRQLAGAVSGRVATTQPRLEFRTSSGAVLPVSDGVTVELLNGSGTLVGTLRAEAQNGVATFTNLRIDGSGVHQLRFTSGGTQLSGSSFTVTQELATLQVLVQPAGAVDDDPFATQPVILLLDDAGLPYLPARDVVATIASGSGDLRGTRTIVSSAGRATFTNLRINDAGVHRLKFETSSPARSVLSNPFTVIDD